MKKIISTVIMFCAICAAVANPNPKAVEAAHIVPASQWKDTIKAVPVTYTGKASIECDGVKKVMKIYHDQWGHYYVLAKTSNLEVKAYVDDKHLQWVYKKGHGPIAH